MLSVWVGLSTKRLNFFFVNNQEFFIETSWKEPANKIQPSWKQAIQITELETKTVINQQHRPANLKQVARKPASSHTA